MRMIFFFFKMLYFIMANDKKDLKTLSNIQKASPSLLAKESCKIIESKINTVPLIGIVLGSGMGDVANSIENSVVIPYNELPGFTKSTVEGHPGNIIIGFLGGVPVACLQGRVHFYEGGSCRKVLVPIYTLKLLGCKFFLATTAVGSLNPEIPPGSIVAIKDHINMQGCNPLVGPNDSIGPRFPSLLDAYSPFLRKKMFQSAKKNSIKLYEGVYLSVLGPSFETPAEIRAFKLLGADVVGMSLVGEIIAARHCGMECCALSIVVNLAAGLDSNHITHEETLHYSNLSSGNMEKIVLDFARILNN
jgi:xanthosine phosphorylase